MNMHDAALAAPKPMQDDPTIWRVDDALWAEIQPLLVIDKPRKKPGAPRADDRGIFNGLVWLARTGSRWATIPRRYGAKSTVHDRFQEWVEYANLAAAWARFLAADDGEVGIDWRWQAADGCLVKAPLGKKHCSSALPIYKGAIAARSTTPLADSVVICLDELGALIAKSYPGARVLRAARAGLGPTARATQEIDDGRWGTGYRFGAFRPVAGDALTHDCPGRTTVNGVDFLERVACVRDPRQPERPPRTGRAARLAGAPALGVRLPAEVRRLAQSDRAVVEDAARPRAQGAALRDATAYWNRHRHPFVWGRRRRRRARRRPGVALLANAA